MTLKILPFRRAFCLLLTCFISQCLFAGNYEDAWKALNNNDRKTAQELLVKAMDDPRTSVDAFITYIYIKSFEGKEDEIADLIPRLYDKLKDPSPYLFALWFNGAALGSYGKKSGHQLQLLDRLLTDNTVNGSIRSAAHYFKALQHEFGNDIEGARREWKNIEAVSQAWQMTGPFDNLSGSGFNKDHGPLQHPETDASFTSFNDAKVSWFTPTTTSGEGYTYIYGHFQRSTAIAYAQSFVYSPEDRQVLLNAGVSGSLKVWVNDQPVLACSKELVTEMDYFTQFVRLRKGYNRLLVQVGYTNSSTPNFIIRLTDDHHDAVKGLSWTPVFQPYTSWTPDGHNLKTDAPPSIPHFAEEFFEKKIASEPDNLVNYILLTDVYLRSLRTTEARQLIEQALQRFPDNLLLRVQRIAVTLKEKNRTLLMEEVERMKEKDPDCLLTMRVNIERLIGEEKYDEAFRELDRCIQLYGENPESWVSKLTLYSKQNKMDELVKAIQTAYDKYPDNSDIVGWMYSLKVNGYKDTKGAVQVLETFLKNNYDFQMINRLITLYNDQGQKAKALQLLTSIRDAVPYDPEMVTEVSRYYFDQAAYDKAAVFGKQALALAPYAAVYWENLGLELQQQHLDTAAIHAFSQALYYDANRYSAREHLRDLQKKPSVWKAFPETDVYKAIKDAAGKHFDNDYFYILDEKYAIVYPEIATEEYTTNVVRILTAKGIDSWKELNVPYNSNTQTLKIEKAEVVKQSGSVVPAEQNENQIVFTGLETGDAIVLKYKVQHYAEGRVTRHFWDNFSFTGFAPELLSRYCLLVSNKVKFDYKMDNAALQPAKTPYDDFTLYTWEMNNPELFKEEPFMPALMDVSPSLHLSTIPSWKDISDWYSDLSIAGTDDDFEVRQLFSTLFPQGADKLSDREKAMRIYKYITANIHYSSVSFRQGAYIPQKASVTINTRLGDCKDLSGLFMALARLCGLRTNMVLVSTRNNSHENMLLPSLEFNHCVVRTYIDGKPCFLELTDNYLPFGSLPPSDIHATCLVIPSAADKSTQPQVSPGQQLEYLGSPMRSKDCIRRTTNIHIDGSDLKLASEVHKTGALASGVRETFAELSVEKQKEQMLKALSSDFKNPVKLDSISFGGLTDQSDSVSYTYYTTIQNEVIDVGNMHMIKVPLPDVIASLDNFSQDHRQYPFEYWRYENTDEYETRLTIEAPAGTKFTDLPQGQTLTFKKSSYSLQYILTSPRKLTILRKASLQRDEIQAADYTALKDFFSRIVKAESKYVVFK